MGSEAVASSDHGRANLLPEILTSIAKLLCPLLSLSKKKKKKIKSFAIETLGSATTAAAKLRSEEATASSDRDWAKLLPEILTSIAKLLCPLDYSNFSGVCTSWASIASPANVMPRPLPLRLRKHQPFVLLSGDEGERSESCNLFDFSTNSYHKIDSFAIETLGSATTAAAKLRSEEATASSDRDWAKLLPEILTSIAKLLCPLDYFNFSGVCTSWASIASPANVMPLPLPLRLRKHQPFVLLSGDEGERSESCNLFDFSTNSYHKIDSLPEIRAKWVVGSQFGWLAVTDELSNPSLVNPFTRSQIELPPITTLPHVKPIYDSKGTLVGYQFYDTHLSLQHNLSLQQFRIGFGRQKVVVSNPSGGDFAAVALHNYSLIFVRPGEGEWNRWIPRPPHSVVDVIYRDGKFLALTNCGDVYVVDFSRPPKSLKDSIFSPRVNDGYCVLTRNIMGYLVDSNGVLLHVKRYSEEVGSRYQTYKIDIQRLDPETETWVPVTNLGDSSLFIGTCCSTSVQASETSWVKRNCVYFNELWAISVERVRWLFDFGIFNLSDGSFETCYLPEEAKLTWPPPTWITSPLI